MKSEADPHGTSFAAAGSLSAAEKLRQKHEAEAIHNPTVEDVVDEEDIAHPPPSVQVPSESTSNSQPATNGLSANALGKQKAKPETSPSPSKSQASSFNAQSEDMFPALGGAPKASATNQPPMAWGSKKPATVRSGLNGVSGSPHAPSLTSSATSTPKSGIVTPPSLNVPIRPSSQGLSFPQKMQMPGKHLETIRFAPHQLRSPKELRKPFTEIVKDINRRSKAKVEIKSSGDGIIVFEGRGPVDATRQTLKDLAKEVGSKQQIKVPIPLSVRPHIIGRQGATIQNLQKQTGAKIQIPRTEESPGSNYEDDDSQTIDVSIEGDACAAELARREVENIAKERASNVNIRLRDIPAELFPFIAGPHNSRIPSLEEGRQIQVHVPHYHTWSGQAPPPPPPPSAGLPPSFVPNPSHAIKIAGDRLGAQEARAEIERQVEQLRKQITLSQMQIDQGRHQFILGHENSLHDFLNETGCAIIMPPRSVDSETLVITGPPGNIESAMDRVYDLASAMQMCRIDIARQHANAPLGPNTHARALTRFFQHRQAIEQLEQQYNARIVLPNDEQGSPDWEVYVKDGKNGMRAKQEILNLIAAHPPSRVRHVEMDPFFHQHVHDQSAHKLGEEFGVHLLSPESSQGSNHMVLVCERPPGMDADRHRLPTQAPSAAEVEEFQRNLALAQQHIQDLIAGQDTIQSASFQAPSKYHDKIRKFVHREQESLPAHQVAAQIHFQPVAALSGASQDNGQQGILRGPGDVHELAAKIAAFVEGEKRDELERGLVSSIEFPQKHMSHLIGRRGENVIKLREEYDVDIQTKEGKVDIIGPKAKADLARNKILALAKQLQDESTHVLLIPSQYHGDIIGSKGSQVNHLQDRYNVRIHFPRSGGTAGEDRSTPDDASEMSAPRNRRPNQGPNEVIVKGPSRGADAARDELLSLLRWTQDNSHTSTISVARKQLPFLIGSRGQEMEALRLATGARIDIPGKESADAAGRIQIQVKGTKKQVEEASEQLEQKVKAFDSTVTKSIDVDSKHHKNLIGPGGSNIRNIVVAAGGSDDRRGLVRTVHFPPQGSDDNTIRLEGSESIVNNIAAAIEAFVLQRDRQTTEVVEVPPEKHRLLIGHGGVTRREIESRFKVGLSVPRPTDEGPSRSQVKVSGQREDVERAKAHILSITHDLDAETIEVPRRHHHAVADNGQFFRRLRNNHNVTVQHGNHKPPRKPIQASMSQGNGSDSVSMPLITDDPGTSAHSFVLLDQSPVPTEDGTIPWILSGAPENIQKARTALEKALKAAESQQPHVIGHLILPDPRLHKYVIGAGGSKINEIRRQTECRISVPRDHKEGEAIEIVGRKDGVEEARDIILEAVSHGGRRE